MGKLGTKHLTLSSVLSNSVAIREPQPYKATQEHISVEMLNVLSK